MCLYMEESMDEIKCEALVTAAEQGSLSKAAKAFGTTPSPASAV